SVSRSTTPSSSCGNPGDSSEPSPTKWARTAHRLPCPGRATYRCSPVDSYSDWSRGSICRKIPRMECWPLSIPAAGRACAALPTAAGCASTSGSREKGRRSSLPGEELFEPLLTTDELRQATGDRAWLQAMLDAERALALAEADVGLIPADAARAIAEACDAASYDAAAIGRSARTDGLFCSTHCRSPSARKRPSGSWRSSMADGT